MKRRTGIVGVILIALLLFCSSAQSQPISGTYDTKNTDFAAGKWTEILYGGAEGKPGNEIRSGATEFYLFKDAILNDVILLGMPRNDQPFYEYRTVYKGGTLTLYNNPDAGWYNAMDEEGAPYVINLENTIVVTKKYVGEEGKPTGEIEFALFAVDANFKDYHGYSACITARFDRGAPVPVIPVEDGDPLAYGGDLSWAIISIKGPVYIEVPVDIKPGSCPNPVNLVSKGVLPVAVLGTEDFDVTLIDPATIKLNGIAPLRWALEDVGTPFMPCTGKRDGYACNEEGPDGYLDLSLKFDTQAFVASLGPVEDREPVIVHLKGNLKDGTPIQGEDVIIILDKAKTYGMGSLIGNIVDLIANRGANK